MSTGDLGQRIALEAQDIDDFIALGESNPRLLLASSDVPRGPQPGCIVQRAAPDADHAIPRQAANPGAALGANEAGVHYRRCVGVDVAQAPLGGPVLGNNDTQRDGAARQALAIQAVAGIDRSPLIVARSLVARLIAQLARSAVQPQFDEDAP